MGKLHRWGMIIAFIIIVGCAYIGIRMVFMEDKDADVPSVTGMQLVDAVDALQQKGLLAKVDRVDSPMAAETVVSQNLPAGEKVSKGKVILLRVSKGGAIQLIPDVRSLSFEEGVKRLSDAGFKVNNVTRVTDRLQPDGTIIAQNPASPQQVAANCMVSLLVSSGTKGAGAFIAIPDLMGKDQTAAAEMLEQLGLKVGQTAEAPSQSVAAGSVMATRPRTGAKVPAGSLVNLTIARAPLPDEAVQETPPEGEQDKERAEAVNKEVVKETTPAVIPSKLPVQNETAAKKAAPAEAKKQDTPPAVKPVELPKAQTPKAEEPKKPAKTDVVKTEQKESAQPKKTAKVRYQAPPLTKPLSLKIEMTDASGTRVLRDGMAQSGEYISMNVPYTGEARITIFLGGDFVWQDRFN